MRKRVGRSEVVLDADDIIMIYKLSKYPRNMFMEDLQKEMNMTRKSLLVHIKRLHLHELVFAPMRDEKEHRMKLVGLTQKGLDLFNELLKSSRVKNIINEYKSPY